MAVFFSFLFGIDSEIPSLHSSYVIIKKVYLILKFTEQIVFYINFDSAGSHENWTWGSYNYHYYYYECINKKITQNDFFSI